MSKNVLEATERLVEELTVDEKLRLVKRLEQDTWKVRLDRLFLRIDRRRKGRRFTMAEIQREIDAVRRQRRSANHSRSR